MKFNLLAAVLAVAVCTGAHAAEFTLQIQKEQPHIDIRSIKVDGGAVTGLPSGREPDSFPISVTLPDGVCKARLSVFFDRFSTYRVDKWMDFCYHRSLRISEW